MWENLKTASGGQNDCSLDAFTEVKTYKYGCNKSTNEENTYLAPIFLYTKRIRYRFISVKHIMFITKILQSKLFFDQLQLYLCLLYTHFGINININKVPMWNCKTCNLNGWFSSSMTYLKEEFVLKAFSFFSRWNNHTFKKHNGNTLDLFFPIYHSSRHVSGEMSYIFSYCNVQKWKLSFHFFSFCFDLWFFLNIVDPQLLMCQQSL